MSAYAQAKLQLDQATGTILENNNVVIDEVKNGRVSKTPSPIPDVPPRLPLRPGRRHGSGRHSAGSESIVSSPGGHFGNSFQAGNAERLRSVRCFFVAFSSMR